MLVLAHTDLRKYEVKMGISSHILKMGDIANQYSFRLQIRLVIYYSQSITITITFENIQSITITITFENIQSITITITFQNFKSITITLASITSITFYYNLAQT